MIFFFLARRFATTGSHGAGMHGPKDGYVLVTAINMYKLCPCTLGLLNSCGYIYRCTFVDYTP